MKALDRKTIQFVNHELHLLKDEINRNLKGNLIPTPEPLSGVNTLFNVELSITSLGNKKFTSRR